MFSQGHKSWTLGNYYKQFLKILVDNPQYLCKFHKKNYKWRSSPRSPLQAVDNPGWVRQPQPSWLVGEATQLNHLGTSLRGISVFLFFYFVDTVLDFKVIQLSSWMVQEDEYCCCWGDIWVHHESVTLSLSGYLNDYDQKRWKLLPSSRVGFFFSGVRVVIWKSSRRVLLGSRWGPEKTHILCFKLYEHCECCYNVRIS